MSSFLPDPDLTAEVSPQSVADWLELPENERPRLIDCRQAEEIEVCSLPGHEWIPLGEFPDRLNALTNEPHRGLVIYCHHGMRSLRAAMFLRAKGFHRAFSMHGGIDAWSLVIDTGVARY